MIIKSMSRKEPTFTQLYDYITRDGSYDSSYQYAQNFYSHNREQIIEEFARNARLVAKRKNGNYLYHEIISITRSDAASEARQKELLRNVAHLYIQERAKNCLVFGGLHDEKDDNLHIHLMISANELDQRKKHRLTKANFNQIKRNIESYVLERYSELQQEVLITQSVEELKVKRQNKKQQSEKEYQYSRRISKKTKTETLTEKLKTIFEKAKTQEEFIKLLRSANIEMIRIETRKHINFIDQETGLKRRVSTLGLKGSYDLMDARFKGQHAKNENVESKTKSSTNTQQNKSKSDHQNTEPTQMSKKEQTIQKRKAKIKQQRDQSRQKSNQQTQDRKK